MLLFIIAEIVGDNFTIEESLNFFYVGSAIDNDFVSWIGSCTRSLIIN